MTDPRRTRSFGSILQRWRAKQAKHLRRITLYSITKGLAYGVSSTVGATATSYALWWIHSR
ncbi:hypothetical protein [Kitasatospora sp. NPDC001132]